MNPKQNNFFRLLDLVKRHDDWMDDTINLIASENRLSPLVSKTLQSDFGNRVAEGWLGERVFPGIRYYDEIEEYGMELVRDMFHADFADIRPISGTMANMIVYGGLTKPGDTLASISISSGAHISMAGAVPRKVFGLNVIELPFDGNNYVIDLDAAIKVIKETKPRIIVLGGSVVLFPQPVTELAQICKELGAVVLFDAAHVAGLIAAGLFPNPLDQGADIMTMTVCKTIPGPQHAFILSHQEYAETIKKTTFPRFLSGHHLHETVASVLTMEELKVFGKDYSKQVIQNAKVLATHLARCGFNVQASDKGFTETHMLLVNTSSILPASKAEHILEKANIIVNRNMLPADTSFLNPSGLRIGTPEVTRLGMKEGDMLTIANFFKRILIDKEDPTQIKKEVTTFRNEFQNICYCYSDEQQI